MASTFPFRICIALALVVLAQAINAPAALAHALGVDPAELVELPGGNYRLTSKVPQSLAHLITAPELPEHCTLDGSPRGERGPYEVRYTFTCKAPLTAQDALVLPWGREGVMLTVTWADGSTVTRFVAREGGTIDIGLAYFQAGSGSWLDAAKRYTALGIEHILLGIDHLLFVLALLLIVRGPWMLVKTVTAFTVAHSITLALATLGFINVSSAPVEAAIALSIVFLCVEIVHARQGRIGLAIRYPWVVAFAFGLLHGLGFAGALAEIGLPQSEIPIALLFFNIGVEIGQLMFVAVVLGLIWGIKKVQPESWRWASVVPAYVIGTIATYWLFERVAAIFAGA
jgi:hypothetical protein